MEEGSLLFKGKTGDEEEGREEIRVGSKSTEAYQAPLALKHPRGRGVVAFAGGGCQ
jgi:hypothetical protein